MPPGFTGDLRGITYCPEAAIAAAAQKLGRAEQAQPELSRPRARSAPRNVAAGPRLATRSTRSARCTWPGPFKGAPLSLVAITPALAGPYDYGVVVVRVALHVDPLTAQVSAVSDTVPSIIGGIPIRMRSIQVNIDRPNFTINPTNCSPVLGRLAGDRRPGDGDRLLAPTSTPSTARRSPFKPKMTVRQVGGRKATQRAQQPAARSSTSGPGPGDANIKSLSVTLLERLRDRPAPPRQHLLRERAGRQRSAPAARRSARRRRRRRCSTSRSAGPVYAVSGSGGLPRLAFILNGQVNLVPARRHQDGQRRPPADDGPGRPRRPDRPLPA